MKTNILLISILDEKTKHIGTKIANAYELYYVDVADMLEYSLIDEKEIEKACGIEYLKKLRRNVIKNVSNYENTLITLPMNLFFSEDFNEYFKTYCTIVFLNFPRKTIEKLVQTAKTEEEKNALKVTLLAYDEHTKLCQENSDIQVKLTKTDDGADFKKLKKQLDKYFL